MRASFRTFKRANSHSQHQITVLLSLMVYEGIRFTAFSDLRTLVAQNCLDVNVSNCDVLLSSKPRWSSSTVSYTKHEREENVETPTELLSRQLSRIRKVPASAATANHYPRGWVTCSLQDPRTTREGDFTGFGQETIV